jgi:ferric-dicitrate binding protein FerR (iron transport regulator)
MKKLFVVSGCLGCVFAACTSRAIDLKQSKVTQVVNDVQIISASDQKQKAATVNDIFSMPDILRTGTASRAELVAQDETVTRVGANTIFSFDPANRTIDLKQGSLLFHAPHGQGGGTIHTGSATASVLGTTLIVVTTPNGGFKVIDLEGAVSVKLVNGLKQKLDAGQMAFILPGGNQLSPIIVFRLDELTQGLLVKGFNQPLSSLPLIQNQIDKQIKLIQSGKLSDTGLYAGNDATADQVEVLDVNTVSQAPQKPRTQQAPPPSPPPAPPSLHDAENADATINQPSLTDATIPTPPVHVFTTTPFGLTDNTFFNGQRFSGFVARNIFVNTFGLGVNQGSGSAALRPAVAAGLIVDLSPYSSLAEFDMVAVQDFSIEGSVTFRGLSSAENLSLIAGNQFNFTSGISVEADANSFQLSSAADLNLDDVGLFNTRNAITLNSGGSVSLLDGSTLDAAGPLNVSVANDITVSGSQVTADSALLTALNGTIEFDDSELDAASHAIFIAPTAINLNDSTINSDSVTLNGSGGATVSINNSTINAPSAITAIAPNDINVTDSTLNSDPDSGAVTLISTFGSVNVSGSTVSAQNLTVNASYNISFDEGTGEESGDIATRNVTRHYLTLNSGDGILLSARGVRPMITSSGGTASFTAGNQIAVNNADFTSFATVNMAANTINLYNVAFSGTVNLKSLYGLWNNGSIVYGDVNNLGRNTWDGYPINAANGFSGTIAGTGITVEPLGGGSAGTSFSHR